MANGSANTSLWRRRAASAARAGLVAAGVCVAAHAAPGPLDPAQVARSLPQPATSADGFVRVSAAEVPGDPVGFRDPILGYVGRCGAAVRRGLGLPELVRRSRPGLIVVAQDGRTNDTRVVARRTVLNRAGLVETHIWLPSPGFSDFARLRRETARAYLRGYVDQHRVWPRPPGAPPPADVPDWFVQGALRQADRAQAQHDLRAALAAWSDGSWPQPARWVDAAARDSVMASYLVGWMKEKKLLAPYFTVLAAGRPWDGPQLAFRLTGEANPLAQDRAADARFTRLLRKVIAPGTATPFDIRVFASRLLLYPPFYDKMFGDAYSGCTFRVAAERLAGDAAVRRAAARKAREVPLLALGRGEALGRAAFAYMDFLAALGRGEEPGRLVLRLDEAEMKLAAAYAAAVQEEEAKGK